MIQGLRIQGEALTKSIREEGLFSQFDDFKCKDFWLIVFDGSDIQSLLGFFSGVMMLHEKKMEKNFFGIDMSTINDFDITLDVFIETFKKNYGSNVENLNIVILGDIPTTHKELVISKEDRNIADKTISECFFEKHIMVNIEENNDIADYKLISDLSLTLLNAKDKIITTENKVDVSLLVEKLKSMLKFYTSLPVLDRVKVRDFLKNELTKFMVLLGAPY